MRRQPPSGSRRRWRRRTILTLLPALLLTMLPLALPGGAAAAECPCSIWPASVTPGVVSSADTRAVELGVKFRTTADGSITGVRFYKGEFNTGTHLGRLWSRDGTLLASATFTGESATGWQTVSFAAPVPVSAGVTYIASYYAPRGRYASDTGFFATKGVTNGPLTALQEGVDGSNGVYRYATGGGFPASTYKSTNYWVDVVYTEAGDQVAPSLLATAPQAGASNVSVAATVTATFDEPVLPASVSMELRGPGDVSVPGATEYASDTRTATFRPDAALATGTQYVATVSGASDDAGNVMAPASWSFTTEPAPVTCPCTLWPDTAVPDVASDPDTSAVEVGVRFRPDRDGFVTAIRFYKGPANVGPHTASLWSGSGTLLSTVAVTGETATGWQQVGLPTPVAVSAGTTYVASYHADSGGYSTSAGYFTTSGTTRGPLTALKDGQDGPNGVFARGGSAFPDTAATGTNFWVDVVFDTTGADAVAPTVTGHTPVDDATDVPATVRPTATFSEDVVAGSIDFVLRDAQNSVVPASVTYDSASRTATLRPSVALAPLTSYTATVTAAADAAGNVLQAPERWSFTTAPPPPPPPPGTDAPVLVVLSGSAPYGGYLPEILRAEGLPQFATAALDDLSAELLARHEAVVLAAATVTSQQAQLLADWVGAGGNLVAMRPDPNLAALLGLAATSGTLDNGYLRVDQAASAGAGITDQVIQFHGTADRWTTTDTATVAALYDSATVPTTYPAVTLRDVGSLGGQAAAFTYDLPRSVVLTRQGNPAWAGMDRDGKPPIRSNDLFFGGSLPNWVDLDRVAVPQADEQQRLLVNLINIMMRDRMPLPRFWYLPRGLKAVVVATGDDHANGGTAGRFDQYVANSPAGCTPADWNCLRSTSYVYPNAPLTDAQATAYGASGFEVGAHPTNSCKNFTPASLDSTYASRLGEWAARYTSQPAPVSSRFHCMSWSDWSSQPEVESRYGIRLDTNYYYWPSTWITNRPGFMTGSGFPQRLTRPDGSVVDVYQAATVMTDESGQTYPYTSNTLLDNALGPTGYFGALTANMHTDKATSLPNDKLISSALARGVPLVPARDVLAWAGARERSSVRQLVFSDGVLTFTVAADAAAPGLTAMLPTVGPAGTQLSALTRDGTPVSYTATSVKGQEYAMFPAASGRYEAGYSPTPPPPVIMAVGAETEDNLTASVRWITDEPTTTEVVYGTSPTALSQRLVKAEGSRRHLARLRALVPGQTYHYRVISVDAGGRRSVYPAETAAPASFRAPARDTSPPSITSLSAIPVPGGSVRVRWRTELPADSLLLVGLAPDRLAPVARDAALSVRHELSVDDLLPDRTYYYRVQSVDEAGNVRTSPALGAAPARFVTMAPGVADQSEATFRMGTFAGTVLQGGGQVALDTGQTYEFLVPTLPPWARTVLQPGGRVEVSAGFLEVDGATVGTPKINGTTRSLELGTIFRGPAEQSVGWASSDGSSSATFVSRGGSLYAVSAGSSRIETPVPGTWSDAVHVYRIERTASRVRYLIDGVLVAEHAVRLPTMGARVRDERADGMPLAVDWVRLSGDRSSGTFTSRPLDAGGKVTWDRVFWEADVPPGGQLSVSVRTGNTRTPGTGWSTWRTVAPGAVVEAETRYVQYRLTMSARDLTRSPVVRWVGFTHSGAPITDDYLHVAD